MGALVVAGEGTCTADMQTNQHLTNPFPRLQLVLGEDHIGVKMLDY